MTQDSPGHVTRFDQSKEMELNPIEWGTQARDPRNLSSRLRESALAEAVGGLAEADCGWMN